MIIDTVPKLVKYGWPQQNLKNAAQFLAETRLEALPVGRFEVDKERIRGNVVQNNLHTPPDFWEAHRKYVDIHVVITGAEIIRCFVDEPRTGGADYDEAADAMLFPGDFPASGLWLCAGMAAVLYPGEIHKAGHSAGLDAPTKKLILKVLVE